MLIQRSCCMRYSRTVYENIRILASGGFHLRGDDYVGRTAKRSAIIAVCLMVALLTACGKSNAPQVKLAPPSAPKDLKVETTEQGLNVRWKAVPGATGYTLFVGYDERDYEHMIEVSGTQITLKGLKTGTRYMLAATSRNEVGESDFSHERSTVYFAKRKHRDTQVAQRDNLSRTSR